MNFQALPMLSKRSRSASIRECSFSQKYSWRVLRFESLEERAMLTVWGGPMGLLEFDTWDQGMSSLATRSSGFNQYTPLDASDNNEATVVGCNATALAQILQYWQYPDSVSFSDSSSFLGGDSYTYIDYGWPSLNFVNIDNSASTLDYPDFATLNAALSSISYSGSMSDQALLSFAAGVSVQMDYDSSVSESTPKRTYLALLNTWGFGSSQFSREWTSEIKAQAIQNIKDGMPVLAGLYRSGGGHFVILEGYDDVTDLFKINLGWGTYQDNQWWDLGDPATGRSPSVNAGGRTYDRVGGIVYDISPGAAWSQGYGNPEHTGLSPYNGPESLQERWNVTPQQSRQAFQGFIVGQGGKAFALSSTMDLNQGNPSYLYTIDTQGTNRGEAVVADEFEVDGEARTFLAQGPNGDVYLASGPSLYSFDPETSQLSTIVTLPSSQSFKGAIVVDEAGDIYLRSVESNPQDTTRVHSFSSSGSTRWTYTLPSGFEMFHDLAVDSERDRVFVPYADLGSETGLIMLNSTVGSQLGQRSWSSASSSSRLVKAPSVGPDGTVYVARFNELYALNPDFSLSTRPGWPESTSPGTISHAPTVGSQHLYVAHWINDTQIALTARNLQTGAVEWQFTRNAGDFDYTKPIVVGANDVVSFVFAEEQSGPDTFTLYQIRDDGNSFTLLDSLSLGSQGGNIALGPGNSVYVIGPQKITALNDGTAGDAYSGGMGYTDNTAPTAATSSGEGNGSIVDQSQVTLSWSSLDPDGHGLTYDLYLSSIEDVPDGAQPTGAMIPVATGLTQTSYTLSNLIPNTEYQWQVVSSDGQATTLSELFGFAVAPADSADFDSDADVDVADLLALQRGFGLPGASRTDGDADNDEDVDGDDLAIWESQFGAGTGVPGVSFEWATVGNPGNTDDATGYGGVDYAYQISKHEVTNEQYSVFLNAVADTDPNGLFDSSMRIARSGVPGNYSYVADSGWEDRPVIRVTFLDAMRFVNWLDNGQPTGPQGIATTEDGVYSISDGLSEVRSLDAQFFLPTKDEWYKAAYHKNDGATANYWDYPTSNDTAPVAEAPVGGINSANYANAVGTVTDVGSYVSSTSPYGTYDQGGNVWEWTETLFSPSARSLRGGSYAFSDSLDASTDTGQGPPDVGTDLVGFRVASAADDAVSFDWAIIGDPGNIGELSGTGAGGNGPDGIVGAVDYSYRISKHEVTNGQYIAFLNAVAANGDPNGLYDVSMSGATGGIEQSGTGMINDPYVYSPKGGDNTWLNRPVNFISYLDAMRFVNWLENGQPAGDQVPGTTEDGTYTISDGVSEVRAAGASFFMPTEHEWYKAAYYNPVTSSYFDYPTGSNTLPDNGNPGGDSGNTANYFDGADFTAGAPYYTTQVGSFSNSASPYGTFDQGGNVWEWNEQVFVSDSRGLRGDGWSESVFDHLHANDRSYFGSTFATDRFGFRVAAAVEVLGAVAPLSDPSPQKFLSATDAAFAAMAYSNWLDSNAEEEEDATHLLV